MWRPGRWGAHRGPTLLALSRHLVAVLAAEATAVDLGAHEGGLDATSLEFLDGIRGTVQP